MSERDTKTRSPYVFRRKADIARRVMCVLAATATSVLALKAIYDILYIPAAWVAAMVWVGMEWIIARKAKHRGRQRIALVAAAVLVIAAVVVAATVVLGNYRL